MKYEPLTKISAWRRLSVGVWGPHNSPMAQGLRELDLTKTLPYLERVSADLGTKVTITHLMVAAVGRMLKHYPDYNIILRRNRPFKRESIDVFVQVAVKGDDGKADLSGIKIRSCDTAKLGEIMAQVQKRADAVRRGMDKDIESAKSALRVVPPSVLPMMIKTLTSLSYDFGLNLTKLGIKPDPFGSAMVTNVGSFGIPHALVPLMPTSRVPILFCMGQVHDRPRVIKGKVKVVPSLLLTGSFDHRLFDGFQIGRMTTMVDEITTNPDDYDLF